MKILVFLHGTLLMHQSGNGKSREERVQQSKQREESVLDYANYIPIGGAVAKLNNWINQGAEILYLSSHKSINDVEKDKVVLEKYNFPKGRVLWRQGEEIYANVAEKILPDILIEDDCESIGEEQEMTITHIKPELKAKIKSIVVKEFEGIDHLPDNLDQL